MGCHVANKTSFKKGMIPWNKGKKVGPNYKNGQATRFKDGHKPHTWKPIGSTRLINKRYLQIKVSDTRNPSDWQYVHVMNWEERFGPVPKGEVIIFRDGDPSNTEVSNLMLASRKLLMGKNSIANLPENLRRVIHLNAKLRRTINECRSR